MGSSIVRTALITPQECWHLWWTESIPDVPSAYSQVFLWRDQQDLPVRQAFNLVYVVFLMVPLEGCAEEQKQMHGLLVQKSQHQSAAVCSGFTKVSDCSAHQRACSTAAVGGHADRQTERGSDGGPPAPGGGSQQGEAANQDEHG